MNCNVQANFFKSEKVYEKLGAKWSTSGTILIRIYVRFLLQLQQTAIDVFNKNSYLV